MSTPDSQDTALNLILIPTQPSLSLSLAVTFDSWAAAWRHSHRVSNCNHNFRKEALQKMAARSSFFFSSILLQTTAVNEKWKSLTIKSTRVEKRETSFQNYDISIKAETSENKGWRILPFVWRCVFVRALSFLMYNHEEMKGSTWGELPFLFFGVESSLKWNSGINRNLTAQRRQKNFKNNNFQYWFRDC